MKKKILIIVLVVFVILLGGWGILIFGGSDIGLPLPGDNGENNSDAVKAGKRLSNNQCEGEGVPYKLSRSPMDPEDFSIIIPYGLMVGGHVTPIDHQYFSPASYRSERDAYEVYAMADSTIVDIGVRENTNPTHPGNEYRLVFTVTCTYFYYYDLVTSLSPEILAEYEKNKSAKPYSMPPNIKVKAGQLIGRIGGRTLDFAVWDTTKPLKGFLDTSLYEGESWKLFTADPLEYYTDELKTLAQSRYVRTAEPTSGKIDYDVEGKLIGNWFVEGSDGYTPKGSFAQDYFTGHLAFAPDHLDPSHFVVSIGSLYRQLEDDANMQFVTIQNSPQPEVVGVDTGLVKYDLTNITYTKADGSAWDRNSVVKGPKISVGSYISGCALAQLIEARKLKFEFVRTRCAEVMGFSSSAKMYYR